VVRGETDETGNVIGRDVDVARFRFSGRARIARGHEHGRHARGLGDLPRERVFAAACADDENAHG
jgi:hypothetical protein